MNAKDNCQIHTNESSRRKKVKDIVDNLLYYANNDSQPYECFLVWRRHPLVSQVSIFTF